MDHHADMATIQMVIDEDLLAEADELVQQRGTNRSAFLREAVRGYIARIRASEREMRDRLGYERQPDSEPELRGWEEIAAWPAD